MIPILLAASRVTRRCLDMTIGTWANPDVDIRRRNSQTSNAIEYPRAGDRMPVNTEVSETVTVGGPREARLHVVDMRQARSAMRCRGNAALPPGRNISDGRSCHRHRRLNACPQMRFRGEPLGLVAIACQAASVGRIATSAELTGQGTVR